MKHGWRAAALLAVAAVLAACTGTIKPGASSPAALQAWQGRRAQLEQLHGFSLQGRMAATGVVSFGGALSWVQAGERFEARFYGPLGVGAVAVSGVPGDVEVHTKDGTYQTQAPEDFMQDQLGFSVPVEGLRYWVLGLPAPDSRPQLQLDDAGRVRHLSQDGWELDYADYQAVGTLDLPRKFTLSDRERGFRLVIDRWLEVD
ncbi:MAG: outer membrane lipoprotein LolB [Nevskia sp.]|nr:outer membrane lipoprotein LolB [Nevskia sp.]